MINQQVFSLSKTKAIMEMIICSPKLICPSLNLASPQVRLHIPEETLSRRIIIKVILFSHYLSLDSQFVTLKYESKECLHFQK